MANQYELDMNWLNDSIPKPATLRLTVRGGYARQAVQAWLADIPSDMLGSRGRGDWLVREVAASPAEVVVDLTSGGECVADGIRYAAEEAYDVLEPLGLDLEWEQLPRA